MKPKRSMNSHTRTAIKALLAAATVIPTVAQTIYTPPQGYSRIPLAPATGTGAKLTSFSVPLLKTGEFAGEATINNDYDADPDGDPGTSDSQQTISVSGVSWTDDQWLSAAHTVFLADASGAKEAFLIIGNTATTLTVATSFDLLGDSDPDPGVTTPRFPSSTSSVIRKAQTIGSIFAAVADSLGPADRVYLWGGERWETYRYATFWRNIDDSRTNANNDIVFPDEGVFILRESTDPIVLTVFGEVSTTSMITTIPSQGFSSTRFPIATTVAGFGAQFSSWKPNDRLYVWDPAGQEWASYRYRTGLYWVNTDDSRTNADGDVIPGNSAVFIARETPVPAVEGKISSELPYDPDAE